MPNLTLDERKSVVIDNLLTQELTGLDLDGFTFSDLEIGEIISKRVFGGNTNAQLASLMKGQVKMLAILASLPGLKPVVNSVFSQEILQIREIGKIREATGLTPIDLSFLDD